MCDVRLKGDKMKTFTNETEMYEILNSTHRDPHHILGMHEITNEAGNKCLIVRVFNPVAKEITIIEANNTCNIYEMEKIHDDGFFIAVLEGRDDFFRYKLKAKGYYENEWTYFDPYQFPPLISDYDEFLFGEGNHYEIYERLGAHFMEVDGVMGVNFAVWAPNAKRVSVVGNFNDWDGRRSPMRNRGASGIWELFIPGLREFDKYKYEIKTKYDDIKLKQDPYGYFSEVRPNTASIIYDINKYEWHDDEYMAEKNNKDEYNSAMSVYELHLGSWQRGDNNSFLGYRELAEKICNYVTEMGYTHIELLPVTEHPFDGSWGYQVTGYYAPTSRFGNPDDFMYFIDYMHQHGISVIMDWVPAHFPKDDHGLARFDGSCLYEHADPKQGEHPDWGTYIYNYGRAEVKNFLIANALFWLGKYHIDGLRVDAVASMLYLDYGKTEGNWIPNKFGGKENIEAIEFLKHMNSIIDQRFPKALMIAEESTSWSGVSTKTEYGGLGFKFKWNMGWMNDFLRYASKDPIYKKYHHNDLTFSMVYAYSENFILVLSHDEVVHGKGSMIGKMPGDYWQKFANLRVSYGYMFGHPGKKLLFMGNDFGQFNEWDADKSLDWNLFDYEKHKQLNEYIKDLNHLYRNEPALWRQDFGPGGFEWVEGNDFNNSIVSFIRKSGNLDEDIYVVCNFTPVPQNYYKMGVLDGGEYQEIFNSDSAKYGGSDIYNPNPIEASCEGWNYKPYSIEFRLPPLSMVMFKRKTW